MSLHLTVCYMDRQRDKSYVASVVRRSRMNLMHLLLPHSYQEERINHPRNFSHPRPVRVMTRINQSISIRFFRNPENRQT